ncbi:MAG: hypothetical protein K0Q72_1111 [Armatimonadetes bacterium]|nr:hypothetical protein [Armatimonadota bacterium]
MLASSGWRRGGGMLALLALLTVGLLRPAPAAPRARSASRGASAQQRAAVTRRTASAAAGTTGGSGSIVRWGSTSATPADLSGVISASAGFDFTAALRSDGTVITWGTGAGVATPVPTGLAGVTAIAVGDRHTLALKSDGTVVAWGDNPWGEASVPPGLTGIRAVAAGYDHSCAVKSDGTVVVWGRDIFGIRTPPAGLRDVIAVAAGEFHCMALRSDGTVVAWGQSSEGRLNVPAGLTGVVAIAAGDRDSLALKSDGTVVAWGPNDAGETDVPAGLTGVVAIASRFDHSLALRSDGTVVGWGWNASGQVNVPALTGATSIAVGAHHSIAVRATSGVRSWGFAPTVPAGLNDIKSVTAYYQSLALRADGTAVGWGENSKGQATIPAGLSGVTALAAGFSHSMALKSDGTVAAWGARTPASDFGQTAVPAGLAGVTAIAAGADHSLALKSDGTVAAWGRNNQGQLNVPADLRGVMAISAGSAHSLALKSDGTVVGWGNTVIPPVLADVTAISAGFNQSVALKSDGTIVDWNNTGELNVRAGISHVKAMSTRVSYCLALLSDGTVVGWDDSRSEPIAIPADLAGVSGLSVGVFHGLVLVPVVNQVPTLTPPADVTTREDTASAPVSFMVADDSGADGVIVTADSSEPGLVQSFGFSGSGADRSVTITPAPNANGTATITLTASDGALSASVTFTLTVTPVNDAPSFIKGADQVVNEDAGAQSTPGWATQVKPGPTTDEFTQNLTFEITANSNPGLFSTSPAVNGTTGELTYTPAPNAHGMATITVRLRDDGGTGGGGQDTSATVTFTIRVNPVNDGPTAAGQFATTPEDTEKTLTLSASDLDGDALTYTVVTPPAHGTLSGSGASRTYAPAANYYGSDSFTFRVRDGSVDSNTATVSLTVTPVNDLPVAVGESFATPRGTTLEIPASGVLGNDTDVDGNPLTAQLVTSVNGGTLTLNANGSLRYTPRIGFSGTDSFTYRAHDGTAAGNAVTVSLQVSAAPPASTPDGQVEATGSIPMPGGTVTFNLTARKSSGRVMGALVYTDPVRARSLTSTELTAVVVTGRKARVFGKGKLGNGTVVDFVVDVDDVADPGRGKDRFQLETGSGVTVGAVLTLGNVTVRP